MCCLHKSRDLKKEMKWEYWQSSIQNRALETLQWQVYRKEKYDESQTNMTDGTIYCSNLYWMDHKKRPKFSGLEKTHVVSLGKIALAIG